MQRIDENTYIDDTLVTCAEYQLFIDEMREQGKYYQPDHWTSYQFPEGQAREPILGMRYSDATTFCEWLTQHEGEDWCYRLPVETEVKEYPLKPKRSVKPVGCWIINDNPLSRFIWINSVLKDPRNIIDGQNNVNLDLDRNHVLSLALDRVRALALDRDIARDIDRDIDRALAFERAFDLARSFDFFMDMFTLQERIAGRSPAFEGIRLVKYHKQF